jgi:hypothetical protein
MNNAKTALLLARPMDRSDPLLTSYGDGYAVDMVLDELLRLGVFDEIVISIPDETPDAIAQHWPG